ncbi:hypothetical protein A3780_15230 [Kosakonia radicincitans]|uniref:hypothetical protein n=1 Tax=Kosakonia radicincitans TaxID=283686 RepID=UPI0009035B73|nr:hypothetical protein [Kosakonia radicincitans]APG18849.1 hypothetical protein A3780_15230 [Kosakonia radicincitans]
MPLFNTPKQSKSKPVPKSHKRERDGWEEDPFEFSTRNGYCLFAYKGVVLEKIDGIYSVARQIKIKGFPKDKLHQLNGVFSSGAIIGDIIDLALEKVDPERHAEVREQYRNWCCPRCGTHYLYDSKDISIVYRYYTNEWREEIREATGRKEITCNHCFTAVDITEVEFVGDEVMR